MSRDRTRSLAFCTVERDWERVRTVTAGAKEPATVGWGEMGRGFRHPCFRKCKVKEHRKEPRRCGKIG